MTTSNEFSNIAWTHGDIPRNKPGSYIVYLSEPMLGTRYTVASVRKISNGYMTTINGLFSWDLNCDILAWSSTEGLDPILP